jgi:hypothetical protein
MPESPTDSVLSAKGLSFALSNATDFKDIFPWTNYPSGPSHSAEHCVKAPTRVALASENPELERNAWGYQVEPGMKAYAWTKLLLDQATVKSEFDDPDLDAENDADISNLCITKSPKTLVTEYLKGLNAMFTEAVVQRLGENVFKNMPVDVWLTVPATWSEKAKLLTKDAALKAGFASKPNDRLMLIPEPEAAAHLALKSGLHTLENFVAVRKFPMNHKTSYIP